MEILATLEDIIKKKLNTPTLLLFILLYLFTIDIITIFLLGYKPKDYFLLLDFQKIIYYNTGIIIFFTILRKITSNAFFESAIFISILLLVYSVLYGDYNQLSNLWITVIFLLTLFTLFSYDYYKNIITSLQIIKKIFTILIACVLFTFSTLLLWNSSISKWNTVYSENNQLFFNTKIGFHSLFESKSFATYRLRKLYSSTKVYIKKDISYINKFKDSNDTEFITIPYDGYKIDNNKITVNYYDNNSYRIFLILDKNNCKKNPKKATLCRKITIITKQIHSHDTSKGYDFVSSYNQEVGLSVK